MRHGKKFNHLGRTAPHRKAMLANMASSLVKHKRINTTIAKAKALRIFIEPLITKAKSDTTHSRRTVFKYLKDKYAVTELFRDIAPKIADRDGGYTRILKTGNRLGDNADMCFIELVDFNEVRLSDGKSTTTETKKRTRRGRAKKQADTKDPAISKKEDKLVEDAQIVDETSVEEKKTSSKETSAEDSNNNSETKDDK
jgi:large subunit ribosomal protein L17